jgi:NAD(P)-dependent dehydrogenase (short-subunit alcohol dehydrogenase family)
MSLQGKTVIITGASAGLGKATATTFAKKGANVVLAARRPEKLFEVAKALEVEGAKVLAFPTDVSKFEQVEGLVQKTVETFGGVDVLFNNAAIDYPAPVTDLTPSQWDEIIAVNLSGVFYTCKLVFPIMMKQKEGRIINISSVAGKKGWKNATAYCATKFALTGFTQALNEEGKPHNICCSVIYPGGMDTEWYSNPVSNPLIDPMTVAEFIATLVTLDPRFVVNEAVVTPLGEMGYP